MFSHQIRTRILVYFIAISVFISVLFSALSLLFSYYVEDSLFTKLLNTESTHIQQQLTQGELPTPKLTFVRYYSSFEQLPRSIQTLLEDEPERIEFPGEGSKHYHLKPLAQGYLVAEVSEYLIVRSIKGNMAKMQLFLLLLISLVVALMSWSLAKRIGKPIGKLVDILSKVKNNDIPQGFSNDFANDEIGFFAIQLDNAFERTSNFIEREQHFTRDVSHELRTPVAINQGALTLLQQTELTSEQQQLVTRMSNAQEQMEQCIHGLLMLAREENVEQDSIMLLPLIEESVVSHHEKIENKDIELLIDVPNSACECGNKLYLSVIISNLIANAFEHTHQGTISVKYQEHKLSVTDTGEGISPDILSEVHNVGVKGEQSSGFGIGLSLVQRLCEKTNIMVDISSSNEGTKVSLIWA